VSAGRFDLAAEGLRVGLAAPEPSLAFFQITAFLSDRTLRGDLTSAGQFLYLNDRKIVSSHEM
jgi:hypothetical protein